MTAWKCRRTIVIFLAAVIVACDGESPPGPGPVSTPDITIQFIQRLPAIDFVPGSTNPRVEGWPAVGQAVTWRANLKN